MGACVVGMLAQHPHKLDTAHWFHVNVGEHHMGVVRHFPEAIGAVDSFNDPLHPRSLSVPTHQLLIFHHQNSRVRYLHLGLDGQLQLRPLFAATLMDGLPARQGGFGGVASQSTMVPDWRANRC